MEPSFRPYKLSEHCQRIHNPIISFVEKEIAMIPSSEFSAFRPKDAINVSYGDPTFYKDFKPDPKDLELLSNSVGKFDGYPDFSGLPSSRRFLAEFYSSRGNFPLTESDIFITHGVSLALWLAISSLADRGDNILLPEIGFCFPEIICNSNCIKVKKYGLLLEKNSEIDLKDLETKIDEKTKAILINNPSNPLGSVFSRKHIEEIVKVAEKFNIPLIVDEVYEDMVFPGVQFVSFIEVSKTVPILLCAGLTKKYFGPGWRTGWLILNGPEGVFDDIKIGVGNLSTVIMNSNTICMQVIPEIVGKDKGFLEGRMKKVGERVEMMRKQLMGSECYEVAPSFGAIYAVWIKLEKFKNIMDTKDFCIKLFKSLNVFCIPAECFGGKNFIRVVACSDEPVVLEFCNRLKEFYFKNKA